MKTKTMTLIAGALAGTLALGGAARAELIVPDLSYRTGPFAAGGIPYSDGFHDYFTLLNERDGGIGGQLVKVPECETAYNTEKGVECYEATKGNSPLAYNPLSTGITYQLIPKVSQDGVVLYTPGYGRTSAANGKTFEWIFNYPGNYWDGASVMIKYLLSENGDDLKGKKITLLYHNSAYGKEPIRTLEELSKKHGFEFSTIPVDSPGQEQKSQWLQIRREKPDYVLFWGWGVMNQVAIQEAANIRFPMENMIGIWWAGSENDVKPAGAGADGYKAVTLHGLGMDYPIYADLKTHVYDAGKAAGAGDQGGTAVYSRGMYAALVISEAIRKAQELAGHADVTAAEVREGFENLEITEARMTELGLPGFGQPFKATCEDHGGPGAAMVQQWDASAQKWTLITDFIAPDDEVLTPLIAEDSAAYAKEAGLTDRCN
ncbi:ABC transporter substrate-binding protein [Frigidibacter sp. MR17.24]|uniref:ABC transporter substrate-binding protein n=1 Tax=Frigidibacter sp. MR17.24 TaxID=3127345 RepID=UPI003012B2C4